MFYLNIRGDDGVCVWGGEGG